MDNQIISVSQLNFYIKSLLDSSEPLKNIFIVGEISNLTDHYRSGHIYLSLKDEKSVVKCVMFSSFASRLRFKLENGMSVIARGRVSAYEATGQYQLYIEDMQPDGIGALSLAFEQLKTKLNKQGLFNTAHKKQLPKYPQKIGVITSPVGAARRDIEQILNRRYPLADIIFYSALVQGDDAPRQLIGGVEYFNTNKCVDVIILGRGGGSLEDLWAFNNEQLANAIYNSEIPIISAVGHETDFTISDLVADVRAATPSAAAELAVPNTTDLITDLFDIKYTLKNLINKRIQYEKQVQNSFKNNKGFYKITDYISNQSIKLDSLNSKLHSAFINQYNKENSNISHLTKQLQSLNPLAILTRGYSIASKNNNAVRSVAEVSIGDSISIKLSDGTICCNVAEIKEDTK